MKLFIKILLIFFLVVLLLFLLIYFSPPMNDRRFLLNQLEQVSIYSDNGKCDNKLLFSMINNEFDYSPMVRCIYQSTSSAEETVELYEESLVSNDWKCFDEDIYVDWYDRSYFKNGFRLNVLFFTNGKIDIELFESESPATINNICLGASIEYPEPYQNEQGLRYTPSSHWVINR